MDKKISYGKLFIEMLKISTFTFGGGFVIIGMMQKKFCDELHWVSDEEVLDMSNCTVCARCFGSEQCDYLWLSYGWH